MFMDPRASATKNKTLIMSVNETVPAESVVEVCPLGSLIDP